MGLRRDLRPCRPRLYVNVNLERVHGDVVGDADPLTYRRDSVGGTHDRHVTMKTTPLTVSWIFESCVGHGLRLLEGHPRSQHTPDHDRPSPVMTDRFRQCFRDKLVGARGFEPPTPRSRTELILTDFRTISHLLGLG